jgi:predicted ATPase/DNA-binding SARP family transcriptional activator
VQVGILGPLVVADDAGAPIELSGARLRALLARLALDAGRPVSAGALIDAVWSDSPPADAANALQALVSRLRRTLGDAALVGQSPAGYRLAIEADEVDATRFERLVEDGARALRVGDPAGAVTSLDEALDLWRGPLLADLADAGAAAARFDQLRISARIDRAAAEVALGETDRALGELDALHADHPLDEHVAAALVSALAAAGRQADALGAYERIRATLADELGVDPSAELRAAHLAVLRGEVDRPTAPRRTNLRAQLTSFVGRDEELARVAKALAENRLVTIVGPGGAGKTRLASEAGAKLMTRDGVWLAELAAVTDGADVAQVVLGALGLREKHLLDRRSATVAVQDAETRLVDMLADKTAVIVLDNCEHVIDASARLAEHLLGLCPDVRVLATSREPLGIIGEVVLAVPPLGQPPADSGLEFALGFPAVRLFADRAAAARPDIVIDEHNIGAVVEIVRRLDGLPLAIELAAARLRAMSIADVAERLSDRFRLLTGGSRTALPRHRTLRAVVEWSWDLLTDDERLLAERIAVFPAGVTTSTAAAVCSDARLPVEAVPDVLASLLDKSLLQLVADGDRYRMLETIREYGVERLAERGELEAVRARHADHFADLVAEAQIHLLSAGQLPWFERLTVERENILAALRFRCDSQDAAGALQIAVDLGGYAMMTGSHDLGPWLTDALAVPGSEGSDLRWVAAGLAAMSVASSGADPGEIDAGMQQLAVIAEHLADAELPGRPLLGILRPAIAFFAGLTELTDRLLAEGLVSDDAWTRAAARMFRANIAENNGALDAMAADIELALADFRALGERWGLANTLSGLATLFTLRGELDQAEAAFDEAVELMRLLKSSEDESFLLVRLADVALRRGDADKARALMRRALDLAEDTGAPMESAFMLSMLADMERLLGNLDVAEAMSETALARLSALPPSHPAMAHGRAITLALAARMKLERGEYDVAMLSGAYDAAVLTRDAPIAAVVGVVVAAALITAGRPEAAAEALGAAAAMRGADDRSALEVGRLTAQLIDVLGRSGFDTAYERGRGLDRAAALTRLDPAEALTP